MLADINDEDVSGEVNVPNWAEFSFEAELEARKLKSQLFLETLSERFRNKIDRNKGKYQFKYLVELFILNVSDRLETELDELKLQYMKLYDENRVKKSKLLTEGFKMLTKEINILQTKNSQIDSGAKELEKSNINLYIYNNNTYTCV